MISDLGLGFRIGDWVPCLPTLNKGPRISRIKKGLHGFFCGMWHSRPRLWFFRSMGILPMFFVF